jgi:hypothetical protein
LDCLFSTEKDIKPVRELLKKNEEWKKYKYKIRLNIRGTTTYLSVGKPQLVGKPTVERTLSASEKSDNVGQPPPNITGSFSFLHLVIIAQKREILKYLIDNHKGEPSK